MNLKEAAQQALEALETEPWSFTDWLRTMQAARTALRAALAEDAMQRLTDVQQEMDCYGDGNVYRGQRSSDSKTPTLTINGMPAITALRAALAEDRSGDTGKTSDHFPDAGKMVATDQKSRQVEPVAWMRADRGHVDFHRQPDYLPLYTTAPPGIVARAVATERERIAAWVEDMCVGLDAKTIANGIRNGGNDDIRAFEVRK